MRRQRNILHMNGMSWLMHHNFVNPIKQTAAGPQPLYLLLSCSRLSTSSIQPRFTAWLLLGISKPTTSTSHLRLLYSSGTVVPGKTQVGGDLSLHHPENPRAYAPSGQLQTTSEHLYPAPRQLILHGVWRLVVNGHSPSLPLTGLGKSLPLTCQQQPRLNYKRRLYSAHWKGVPSLGERGGCVTGPYRTPTTLGHTTKTQSQSSSTEYIETNARRLPK